MFSKTCGIVAVVHFIVCIVLTPCASAVTFKQYYQGLPNFEKSGPFSEENLLLQKELRNALDKISISEQMCPKESLGYIDYISSGIVRVCKSADHVILSSIISKMAPSLKPNNFKFWIAPTDKERDLIVGYTVYDPTYNDPYFSVWLLKWTGSRYRIHYAGHFLAGDLHAIRTFGPQRVKTIFVRFQSCTECCPWIYLIGLDFSVDPDGRAFQFTYSEDHSSWRPEIEYVLPGKGHSIDATVETRIPMVVSKEIPHLIQNFKIEGGGEEWWIFKCAEYKCDFELYTEGLPPKYQKIWQDAEKL
jgi:hypothetical protein